MNVKKKKKAKKTDNSSIIVVMLAVGIILYVVLFGTQNKLMHVDIAYTDANVQKRFEDQDLIRASGLQLGEKIGKLSEITPAVEKNINSVGYVKFEKLEQVSASSLLLTVSTRTPAILISESGRYVLTDANGYVISVQSTTVSDPVLNVSGMGLLQNVVGERIIAASSSMVDSLASFYQAVKQNQMENAISEMFFINEKMGKLITTQKLLATFYFDDDLTNTLSIVKKYLQSGITNGEVFISGNESSFRNYETEYVNTH